MRWQSQAADAAKAAPETVLSALGIQLSNKTHIHCPYPDHDDKNASWNWTGEVAHCTCENPSKPGQRTENIFGIVARMMGTDYSGAIKWIADALGIDQTVRSGGVEGALNPPDDVRDDTIPRKFLAAEIGVSEADVLMPTTATVGHREMPYYVPVEGGRPKVIANPPAVAFEMVSPEGRVHASRIYLTDDYRDKAKVVGEDGERLAAKKLVANPKGQKSTAGMSVVWGHADNARHAIVCEGAGTGQAVAQAFKDEVAAGDVAVFAAISANGIEKFIPWPAATKITVAADRDEAESASRRGEEAARVLCAKLRHSHTVAYAMPGAPGSKTDWRDVFLAEGAQAVREGVLGAPAYEYRDDDERAVSEAPSGGVSDPYPLPFVKGMFLTYERGWLCMVMPNNDPEKPDKLTPICTPMAVPYRLRYAEQDDEYGLRIRLQGMGGKPVEFDMGREELAGGANDIQKKLLKKGLRLSAKGSTPVVSILRGVEPRDEICIMSKRGWHRDHETGKRFYIAPSGEVIGADDVELNEPKRLRPFAAQSGTLEGWQKAAAVASTVDNMPMWRLALSASLAGVLVDLVDGDTCGINFSGTTSAGKSTAQRLAASVWGSIGENEALLRSLRSTPNGMEGIATDANGSALVLDDMANMRGYEIEEVVYMLAGNTSKTRQNQYGGNRDNETWQTFALFSSEQNLEAKVRGDGGRWLPGMSVRFLDIDIEGGNRHASEEADLIRSVVHSHYGHAGPAFVHALFKSGWVENVEGLRDHINHVANSLAGNNADGAFKRAARVMAYMAVAGEIAYRAGIIPTDTRDEIVWAWGRYCGSSEAGVLDPYEAALERLRSYVGSQWGGRIRYVGGDGTPVGVQGWYDQNYVYILRDALTEMLSGTLGPREFAKRLDRDGKLVRGSGDRLVTNYVPGLVNGGGDKSRNVSVYRIPSAVFTEPDEQPHPGKSTQNLEVLFIPQTPSPFPLVSDIAVKVPGGWVLDFNLVECPVQSEA